MVLGMIGLARLGIWQLDRLAQRRAANAALIAVLESEPLDITTAVLPPDLTPLKDRQAIAIGTFDFEQQGLLKLQVWQGLAGAHLLAPLLLADGKTAVLVDRGWIPEAETAVSNRRQYDEPGQQTIHGYIGLTQTRANSSQPLPYEWFRVDIAQIQQQLPYDLLPIYLVQTPPEGGDQAPPFREEQVIDLSEGPHLSYAIQWFIFALILGGGYLIFVNKSLQHEPQTTEQP
jgi:surfeit locus 1 family protein